MMRGRVLWIGLAISLALNLFIGGTVAGVLLQRARAPEAAPSPLPAVEPAPPALAPVQVSEPKVKAVAPKPATAPIQDLTLKLPPAEPGPPQPIAAQIPAASAPPRPQSAGNPLLRAGDKLPPQIRGPYRQSLREATEASQAKLQESRRARMEVARLMGAPNFNPDALAAALERSRQAELEARAEVEMAMVRFASTMNVRERRVLSEALREPPGGPQAGRGGPGRPGGRGPQQPGFQPPIPPPQPQP
jgi:uncharacterized membrane protein